MGVKGCGRVKFGVPILDQLFMAGVPLGSLILFEGPPGVGKSVFLYSVLEKFLEKGENAVILCFDDDPYAIVSSLKYLGLKIEEYMEKGQLGIVDGFHHPLRRRLPIEILGVIEEVDPGDVNRTLEKIELVLEDRGFKDCKGLLIVDSLNEIILRADLTTVVDFVKALRAESKSRGHLTIATLHLGMEGVTNLIFALEYMSDAVVEFGLDPNLEQIGVPLRRVRVRKVRGAPHSLNWIPYTITDKGISTVDVGELATKLKSLLSPPS